MTALLEQLESGATAINITHQWFDIRSFQQFAREIRDVETVTSIFLRSNQINDQMVVSLAEALRHNRSVKELFLSENLIGDSGARALGEMLSRNCTIELLYLNENKITDVGAVALMKGLQVNSSLKRLFLLKNPITINTSLDTLTLRCDYRRLLALCALDIPRLARQSEVFPLPKDVLRVVRAMLSDEWHEGFAIHQATPTD